MISERREKGPRYNFEIRFREFKASDKVEGLKEELSKLGCTTTFGGGGNTKFYAEQWSGPENDSAVRAILEDICRSEDGSLEERQKGE